MPTMSLSSFLTRALPRREYAMLSRWPIRNKLLILMLLLAGAVITLSASGFHATYLYRGLVRGLRGRATELPLATQLVCDIDDARSTLSQARGLAEEVAQATAGYEQAKQLPDLIETQFTLLEERLTRNLSVARETLRLYREELQEKDESDESLNDNRDEWQTIHKFEDILAELDAVRQTEGWITANDQRWEVEKYLGQLRNLCVELPSFLHNRLRTMVEEVRNQYRTLIFLNSVTSLIGGVLLVVLIRLIYTWVLRPLRLLVKGSRCVAAGDFNYRIHLRSRDEMAELADALNAMTARFRAIRDDLDRQVAERTKQVVRSEQLASVGFLAAGVAHEINNPLAAIALCAESLEGRVSEAISPDADCTEAELDVIRTYLHMIQNEAFRCKGITERLLDFSRLGDVQRHPTDLGELVQGVIDMLGHLGKYHDKRIVFAPSAPVIALANAQEMKQVVLNLLTNGLDAVAERGEVRVELGAVDGRAALTITDNGCGMTDEVRKHLFEPFFTRRRTGQGIGLGLSITYRIVADHGGAIDVYSAGPDRGSRFRVTLPLASGVKESSYRYHQAA
jgi:signal transduction histidine kinase